MRESRQSIRLWRYDHSRMLIVFLPDIPWNLFPRKRTKDGALLPGRGSRFIPKQRQGLPIPACSFIMPRNSGGGRKLLSRAPSGQQPGHLEWIPGLAGLFSGVIPAPRAFRVGVRPVKLALLIASEENRIISEYPLHGRTMTEARDWVRSQIALLGADAFRYTLTRHTRYRGTTLQSANPSMRASSRASRSSPSGSRRCRNPWISRPNH